MSIDWNKYFKYDENSPTCLLWIGSTSYRIKNGITPAGSLKFKKSDERRHAHVQLPKDMIIDHEDGNPWNNKIENLRCVRQELNPSGAGYTERHGKELNENQNHQSK